MVLRLPDLGRAVSASICRLPISSPAVELLVVALLTDDVLARREQFALLLRREPSLVVWCLLRDAARTSPPRDVYELAAWLASHPPDRLDVTGCSSRQAAGWTELHDSALCAISEPHSPIALPVAMANVRHWLAFSIDDGQADVTLPAWMVPCQLSIEFNKPDAQAKDFATPTSLALQACGQSRSQLLWSSDSSLAQSLPNLLAKLARLATLESEFSSALEREKLASLKELAYGASHEINNPLANISTRAQALLRDETDPERRRRLATINSQAFRAHEMISDLMLFAKPPRLVRKSVDVVKLVEVVIAEVLPDAREQGTFLTRSNDSPAAGEIPLLLVDSDQIAVAVKALLSNSLEAIGCGGRIDVDIRRTIACDGNVPALEIAVTDTGRGIPPEVRRHLFDPFYSGREAGRGLGFGLAKCWRIITDHGGQIVVESEPGHGAKFVLRLPVDPPAD